MEAIDDLSSKIVSVFDTAIHSYVTLMVLLIVIVLIYLGKNDMSPFTSSYNLSEPTIDSLNDSTKFGISTVSVVQFLFATILVILFVWVIFHAIKRMFGINIIQTIKNIFSNTHLNGVIDTIDEKIEDIENSFLKSITSSKEKIKHVDEKIEDKTKEVRNKFEEAKDAISDKKLQVENKIEHTKILSNEEVFNVSNNKYTYDDAKSICKAYNSRLATYQEVEDSYNAGGEWCNYGWSENQLALFPTQSKTYDKLQKIKGHENDCGRPGVNGGFMDNSDLKFGVNCYGVKPKKTEEDEKLMKATQLYPKTKEDIELEKKVAFWKENIDQVRLTPFNHEKWSRI
jgi:hypothetical protein